MSDDTNLTLVTSCERFYVLIEYSYTMVANDHPFCHCKDIKVSSFHGNLRPTIKIFDNIAMKKWQIFYLLLIGGITNQFEEWGKGGRRMIIW